MAKIYLSPAAHATDNPTKCPDKCGENIHCNAYMDIVEKRLRQLGFEVKRSNKSLTGTTAMKTRTTEANKWGADIYYVAHTNAGGGRYSMTMCHTDAASKAKADIIHKYRKSIPNHKIKQTKDLYEINQTAMVCLYDELFFHDNADDCRWFHTGGMAEMAEETVQALCEICSVPYQRETASAPEVKPVSPTKPVKQHQPGESVRLTNGALYTASTGENKIIRNGTFYIYDGIAINGRFRVTDRPDRVGKQPITGNVSGWVKL